MGKGYSCEDFRSADLQILIHHIYEFKKGVRNMVLHTLSKNEKEQAESILNKKGVCYIVREVTEKKINIFFGNPECVSVIESFGTKPLNQYSPEEDFILGIMLGYHRNEQCKRYLSKIDSLKTTDNKVVVQDTANN